MNEENILIKVDLDESNFDDGLKKMNQNLKTMGKEVARTSQSLKFDTTSIDKANEHLKSLGKMVSLNEEKLSALKKQMATLQSSGDLNDEEMVKYQREIIDTEKQLERFKHAQDEISNQILEMKVNDSALGRLSNSLKSLQTKLNAVGEKMKSVGEGVSNMGRNLMPLTTGILGLGGASVKLASDMNESMNKVDVAFGNSAGEVKKFADTSLKQFGIARGTALDMASTFGDMGTSMGLSQAEASKMSTSLVGLAGDLSSFKNIGIDEATTALAGVFTGETESLKRLGIVMTDTNVETFALKNGFTGTWKEASQTEKVMYRYKYVLDATKNAQGDFARTSGGLANQSRMFGENMKQLGENIGGVLMPYVNQVVVKLNEWMQKLQSLSPAQQEMIVKIGLLVASIGPLLMIVGKMISTVGIIINAFAFLSGTVLPALMGALTALSAPVLAVIGVITALIAIFTTAYANCEQFRNAVNNLASVVMSVVVGALQFLGNVIKAMLTPVINSLVSVWNSSLKPAFVTVANYINNTVVPTIRTLWTWFQNNLAPIFMKVAGILGSSLGNQFRMIGNVIGAVINIVFRCFSAFGQLWNQFSKTSFARGIASAFKSILKAINNALDGVQSFVNGFGNMVNSVGGFINRIVSAVSDGMGKIGGALREVAKYNPFDAGGFGGTYAYAVQNIPFDAGGFGDINLTANVNFTSHGNSSKQDATILANEFVDIVNKELGRRLKVR